MVRRSFLALFFAVLLMLGQQQAVVHTYMHSAYLPKKSLNLQSPTQKSSSENKSSNHFEVCTKCLSLASFASAIGSQAHFLNIVSEQLKLSTALHQPTVSARFFSYHSRAPPILV